MRDLVREGAEASPRRQEQNLYPVAVEHARIAAKRVIVNLSTCFYYGQARGLVFAAGDVNQGVVNGYV